MESLMHWKNWIKQSQQMKTQLKPSVSKSDHIQGNTTASIELVEYGDYQCPFCGHAYPIIKISKKAWALT